MLKRLILLAIVFLFLWLAGCGIPPRPPVDDPQPYIETLTAIASSPTPTPTSQPREQQIVTVLNDAILGKDYLSESIEATYKVVDVKFFPPTGDINLLVMELDCKSVKPLPSCCNPARGYVVLLRAVSIPETFVILNKQVPDTVKSVKIIIKEGDATIGEILVMWEDFYAFATGSLEPVQLANRTGIKKLP